MAITDRANTGTDARGVDDERLRQAWEALERPDIRVFSTDVFDTLLWRQVQEPVDSFALVAARLAKRGWLDLHLSAGAFSQLREAAERAAREKLAERTGEVEVRLAEIYALIPAWVFRGAEAEDALNVELALERDILVPDLDVLALLRAATERGKSVIAVSDTYFSGQQLRSLLRQPVLEELELAHVFTSCDHRTNKSGGLFEIALAECGVRGEQVLHLGDNEEADVRYPSKLDISTLHFPRRPKALEAILDDERRLLSGASEASELPPSDATAEVSAELTALRGKVATRAEGAELPAALRPFWEFGAIVYGPVFTGFGAWACDLAIELGARRVHCFMREGAFLADLIERAADGLGTDLQAGPLWLNRAVLARAAIAEASKEELLTLLVRRRKPTVVRFLAGVGLSLADLPRFASHARTTLDDHTTRENLLAAIEDDPAARAKVLDRAAESRARVVRYVDALIDGDDLLVVADLGWAGSAQGLLRRVLQQAGRPEIDVVGLYLLNHEGAAARVFEGMRLYGYLGEIGSPRAPVSHVVRSPEVLEQVCMPDFGSQRDLDQGGKPVLEEVESVGLQAVEADAVRRGIVSFQREWVRYETLLPGKLGRLREVRDGLRAILVRSVLMPTESEASLFGRWHHDENQGSDRSELIADGASVERLRYLDPSRLQAVPMEELYWPFALAARVDASWAQLIGIAAGGMLSWEALAGEVETGHFEVAVTRGMQVDDHRVIRTVPRRNRFGLCHVGGVLQAPAIQELTIRPAEHPCVLRLDFLELRCTVQGAEDPVVLCFEEPEQFARLQRGNLFVLNPNVFVAHGAEPTLVVDLTDFLPQTIFRVDVSCGFSVLAIGQLLPTPGRARSVEEAGVLLDNAEATMAEMRASASWRMTKPLRIAKRLANGP